MSNPTFSTGAPSTSLPLAPAGIRIGARLLDLIILGIIGAIIASFVGAGSIATGQRADDVSGGKYFLAVLLSLAVGFVYEAVCTSKIGGTPMKKVLGLRVVDASSGAQLPLQQSAIRWAIPGAFSIIPIIGALAGFVIVLVSLVFLFTDKLRQTVSDKVAKTVVLKG